MTASRQEAYGTYNGMVKWYGIMVWYNGMV